MAWRTCAAIAFLSSIVVACGSAGVGDACNEEGKIQNQCTDGAICGQLKTGALVCLAQCTDGAQCPSGQECAGISKTNIKGCRPK